MLIHISHHISISKTRTLWGHFRDLFGQFEIKEHDSELLWGWKARDHHSHPKLVAWKLLLKAENLEKTDFLMHCQLSLKSHIRQFWGLIYTIKNRFNLIHSKIAYRNPVSFLKTIINFSAGTCRSLTRQTEAGEHDSEVYRSLQWIYGLDLHQISNDINLYANLNLKIKLHKDSYMIALYRSWRAIRNIPGQLLAIESIYPILKGRK